MKRIGAVVVFAQHVTKERAQEVLDRLVQQDILDESRTDRAREYNPDIGDPVFYVP